MLANATALIPEISFIARACAHEVPSFQKNLVISSTDLRFIAVKSDSPNLSTRQNDECESHLERGELWIWKWN